MTNLHDAYKGSLRIVSNTMQCDQVWWLSKLEKCLVCEQLAVLTTLGWDICCPFVKGVYLKTRSVELIDGSTVPMIIYDLEKLPENTKDSKALKHEKLVWLKIRSTQDVLLSPPRQVTVQMPPAQEDVVRSISKAPTKKLVQYIFAQKVQDTKRSTTSYIVVPNFTAVRSITNRIQKVAVLDGLLRLMLVIKEYIKKSLSGTKTSRNKTNCCGASKEGQLLPLLDVDAKYLDSIKNMVALFANLWTGKLWRIDAAKHPTNLKKSRRSF